MPNTPDQPPAAPADGNRQIEWCLLSHTNIGKTTLTRTLLADDVGEVQDAAHVTSQSQRYLLQSTAQGDQLWLWDTPGFGDSVRLYERLKQQGNPIGWFLSNVWDRWRDKPFYMSQRALAAARDHADVMLYLVNAAEDPADAGYWSAEMRILEWMRKPVLVLLNQVGDDTTAEQTERDLLRWRQALAPFSETVRDVLVLDAFTRSWWHERALMQSMARFLPAEKQPSFQRLLKDRELRQQEREQASLHALAEQLVRCTLAQEQFDQSDTKLWQRAWSKITAKLKPADGNEELPAQTREAMKRLLTLVQHADVQSTQRLLQIHQLDGQAASQIQQQLASDLQVTSPTDPREAGLWGALTAGAASGLGADLLVGGMSFGAGAVIGALVGAVTFAGAAWGTNKMLDQEAQRFQLSTDYLSALAAQALLKYLVISHYGRGRGRYSSPNAPQQWSEAVQQVMLAESQAWTDIWNHLRTELAEVTIPEGEMPPAARAEVQLVEGVLGTSLAKVLQRLYPRLLGADAEAGGL